MPAPLFAVSEGQSIVVASQGFAAVVDCEVTTQPALIRVASDQVDPASLSDFLRMVRAAGPQVAGYAAVGYLDDGVQFAVAGHSRVRWTTSDDTWQELRPENGAPISLEVQPAPHAYELGFPTDRLTTVLGNGVCHGSSAVVSGSGAVETLLASWTQGSMNPIAPNSGNPSAVAPASTAGAAPVSSPSALDNLIGAGPSAATPSPRTLATPAPTAEAPATASGALDALIGAAAPAAPTTPPASAVAGGDALTSLLGSPPDSKPDMTRTPDAPGAGGLDSLLGRPPVRSEPLAPPASTGVPERPLDALLGATTQPSLDTPPAAFDAFLEPEFPQAEFTQPEPPREEAIQPEPLQAEPAAALDTFLTPPPQEAIEPAEPAAALDTFLTPPPQEAIEPAEPAAALDTFLTPPPQEAIEPAEPAAALDTFLTPSAGDELGAPVPDSPDGAAIIDTVPQSFTLEAAPRLDTPPAFDSLMTPPPPVVEDQSNRTQEESPSPLPPPPQPDTPPVFDAFLAPPPSELE